MTRTEDSLWKTLLLRRNIVALLAFLGFFNVYTLRVNLSVAIVAMTKNYTVIADDGSTRYVSEKNPTEYGRRSNYTRNLIISDARFLLGFQTKRQYT